MIRSKVKRANNFFFHLFLLCVCVCGIIILVVVRHSEFWQKSLRNIRFYNVPDKENIFLNIFSL